MAKLSQLLRPISLKLDNLLLDPNNPRFAELGQEIDDEIPEQRFADEKVQKNAMDSMKASRFDVAELRETIKAVGFLPMDRIVVRQWRGNPSITDKFVVVEGNRRVTALKWLIELQEGGKETFAEDQIKNFTELEVLLLDDINAPPSSKLTIPGLRHISGIKEWGAYQKARAVYILREGGSSAQEVAQSLGLSTIEANRLWRAYLALEQMRIDEEYSEKADPKLYSYFEEILKRPSVKAWLGWKDEDRRFTNEANLREFYGWMVGETTEEGETTDPKLPEAKSVRQFAGILEDAGAMAVFRAPDGNLTKALARFESEHPQEWLPHIISAEAVLASLSPDHLRGMKGNELEAITNLEKRIAQVITDRTKLLEET
jgi:hypothetical protein